MEQEDRFKSITESAKDLINNINRPEVEAIEEQDETSDERRQRENRFAERRFKTKRSRRRTRLGNATMGRARGIDFVEE